MPEAVVRIGIRVLLAADVGQRAEAVPSAAHGHCGAQRSRGLKLAAQGAIELAYQHGALAYQ